MNIKSEYTGNIDNEIKEESTNVLSVIKDFSDFSNSNLKVKKPVKIKLKRRNPTLTSMGRVACHSPDHHNSIADQGDGTQVKM